MCSFIPAVADQARAQYGQPSPVNAWRNRDHRRAGAGAGGARGGGAWTRGAGRAGVASACAGEAKDAVATADAAWGSPSAPSGASGGADILIGLGWRARVVDRKLLHLIKTGFSHAYSTREGRGRVQCCGGTGSASPAKDGDVSTRLVWEESMPGDSRRYGRASAQGTRSG